MSNNRDSKEFNLSIGGVNICITSDIEKQEFEFTESFEYFFSQDKQADIHLGIHCGLPIRYKLEEKLFGDGAWSLHRSNGKFIFHFASFSPNCAPYNMAILESDFKSGDIYINLKKEIKEEKRKTRFPLREPLGEILIAYFLSQGGGVLLHTCGINDNGRGMLFVGNSGAGKSTIGNLWKDKKGVSILSDDRIIIRKIDGNLRIYGTPWRGEAKLASCQGTPLDKIFFLKHAKENTITKIEIVEVLSRLITCCFPTFWDKKAMAFILKFLSELTQEIPCYELGFVPDKSALDFIKKI